MSTPVIIAPHTLATKNLTIRAEIALRIYTARVASGGINRYGDPEHRAEAMEEAMADADTFIDTFNATVK